MKKQPAVTAHTKQNLIDSFWSLYCEKRLEKITVKEITQKAGYNRGTFYEYFTDVYDVLEQIEQSLIPTIEELPPIVMPNKNIDMPFGMFMSLYEKNNKYYSVLLGDNGDPAFASKLKNSTKPIIKQAFVDNNKGIMSYWFRQNKVLPAEKLVALIYELMENGVMNTVS
ncbi:MAG: Transcriptional regulator [Clostridiales bacterium]|nr:Transcriptional regulator [Clostridiales bacterium]